MKAIERFIKEELTGWKKWEVIWLVSACVIIASLSIYWHDTIMGIISATTGVACVVCTGKGKLCAYIFGTINVVLYAIISFQARYYGEVMLNALYYFPMEFYGFYVWNKNMDAETHEVRKQRMSAKGRWMLVLVTLIGTVAYGFVLKALGGSLPFVDSLSTVASVVAMVISVNMCMQQWSIWIIVDVLTLIMWGFAFANGNESMATLLMWIVYLGNAVIMYFKWAREAESDAV